MLLLEMAADCRSLVFLNILVQVSARVTDITCITQVSTLKITHNSLLTHKGWLVLEVIRNGYHLDTKVHRKPMDIGLLSHYQSHVDERFKRSLLNTTLSRTFKLSFSWKLFHEECERLKEIFSRLRYSDNLGVGQTTIREFITSNKCPRRKNHPSESYCLLKTTNLQTQCADNLQTQVRRSMQISPRCTQVKRSKMNLE